MVWLGRVAKGLGFTSLVGLPSGAGVWYGLIASEDQKICTRTVLGNIPVMLDGGLIRASRPAIKGLLVGIDYKYSLWGLDDQSESYQEFQLSAACQLKSVLSAVHQRTAERLLDVCLTNGGLYIKFGQGLVSMNHVLPKEFSETLKVLQDKALNRTRTNEVETIFQQDFGKSHKEIFKEFSEEPVAAASLAQVFKATTQGQILKSLLVFHDTSSHRVLTTEFIDGVKVTEGEQITDQGMSLTDIDTNLLRVFSEQIFHTGFVHADPHPGNILIRKVDGKAQIVLLDHGLYEKLPANERSALCGLWVAVVQNDYESMKKYGKELNVDDYRLFAMALTQRYIKPTKEELEKDVLAQFMDKKGPKKFDRKAFNNLPEDQKEKIREGIREFHDRMFDVFQKMPSRMMLIMRNLNQIRSIIKEHNTGVERYREMARVAVSGRFGGGIRGLVAQLGFDFRNGHNK